MFALTPRELCNLAYARMTDGLETADRDKLDTYLANPQAAQTVSTLQTLGVA